MYLSGVVQFKTKHEMNSFPILFEQFDKNLASERVPLKCIQMWLSIRNVFLKCFVKILISDHI